MHNMEQPDAEGLWFAFHGSQLLLTAAGEIPEGRPSILPGNAIQHSQYIGDHDGKPCYCTAIHGDIGQPENYTFCHLKKLLDRWPEKLGHLAGRALEIIEWERSHQFCGACGTPTMQRGSAIVRVCSNQACRREHYPRVSPIIIVAVERGPEILLGRSPHFVAGLYSTLAGFVDAGESAEAAVHREVFEETGLAISNLRYFSSQPWPFPHGLMLGYQADYAGGELSIAADELEDAAFFHVDRLPAILPGRSTIAHWLIQDFCRRQRAA
jgi:NAD+ diphosphatase